MSNGKKRFVNKIIINFRMDAGLLINQSKSKIKSVDDAIKVKIKIIN